jgi:iron(III) transport system substrate-binding protein
MLIIINLKIERISMKKITLTSVFLLFAFISSLLANEVNIFSARHYDSDVQLYEKFMDKTGIKVNVISGKSGALEKRIIEEGAESKADLYITADAGRLGAFDAKGMLQSGLNTLQSNLQYRAISELQSGQE